MNDAIRMQLSAYVDGELPENEAELLLRRITQDAELRQEFAEYLALGRLLRGEPGVAAADRLHERVIAGLDDTQEESAVATKTPGAATAIKPLAGIAVAASVALVAIFVLQQGNLAPQEGPAQVAETEEAPVVPDLDAVAQQRAYFLNHAEASSRFGANGINSRLVTLRFSEEVAAESDSDTSVDEQDEELEEQSTQP
ncbi:MAG: sigma-E factor negative regulatory protein [Gammaproteobacteria bacterium]|nr:sigma-E factor negative regulatory protein [Gammaproteobacteria bacterium]